MSSSTTAPSDLSATQVAALAEIQEIIRSNMAHGMVPDPDFFRRHCSLPLQPLGCLVSPSTFKSALHGARLTYNPHNSVSDVERYWGSQSTVSAWVNFGFQMPDEDTQSGSTHCDLRELLAFAFHFGDFAQRFDIACRACWRSHLLCIGFRNGRFSLFWRERGGGENLRYLLKLSACINGADQPESGVSA